ncbi:MAG: 23S rRNA (uracil(1939)-C(5))-methyltransferase RlmD [Bacteroidales bacterium]|nr:23S rRNA (uracil(1939)-C(5))-methyltransferase RlmD [Bacteroidales bacterium]
MSKKKTQIVENLLITDIAAEGVAIGRHENFVIFVAGVIPGDVVNVMLTRKRKNYSESKLLEIVKPSPDRVEPFCQYFGKCGGCKWQMLPYEKQLYYKQKQVNDQLTRIGGVAGVPINNILGADNTTKYRNKLEYTFCDRRWFDSSDANVDKESRDAEGLGFHVQGMFDRVIDIDKCWLQREPSNEIRNELRNFTRRDGYNYYNCRSHEGMMRNLMVRTSTIGETMAVVVFAKNDKPLIDDLMKHIDEKFPDLTSLQYVVNEKFNDTIYDLDVVCWKGRDFIYEDLDGLKFKINAKSFFQTNTEQTLKLYGKAVEYAEVGSNDIVYDLYTGTGTIANFVARHCRKVVGIESVPEAIADARINSETNGITNTSFFVGDMKDVLTEKFIAENGRPDIVILDPPRAGVHENVINVIKKVAPRKIVYVSCNPATQARDISLLSDMYKVTAIQPVDMFPHTHHVENIVKLIINNL